MQMAKEKKKLNVHIKNFFLTIVLLFVLFLTLVGSTVFFDMLGIINFSKIVKRESALGKLPYIGRYVEYSYYQHLTEEERIKEKCPQIRFITMNIRHSSYEYCFFIDKAFSAFYRKDYMMLT